MAEKIDKEFATKLMQACLSISEPFNQLTSMTEKFPGEQRTRFRRELGEIYGAIYTRIMIPIIKEYPDLDPDGPWPTPDEDETGRS